MRVGYLLFLFLTGTLLFSTSATAAMTPEACAKEFAQAHADLIQNTRYAFSEIDIALTEPETLQFAALGFLSPSGNAKEFFEDYAELLNKKNTQYLARGLIRDLFVLSVIYQAPFSQVQLMYEKLNSQLIVFNSGRAQATFQPLRRLLAFDTRLHLEILLRTHIKDDTLSGERANSIVEKMSEYLDQVDRFGKQIEGYEEILMKVKKIRTSVSQGRQEVAELLWQLSADNLGPETLDKNFLGMYVGRDAIAWSDFSESLKFEIPSTAVYFSYLHNGTGKLGVPRLKQAVALREKLKWDPAQPQTLVQAFRLLFIFERLGVTRSEINFLIGQIRHEDYAHGPEPFSPPVDTSRILSLMQLKIFHDVAGPPKRVSGEEVISAKRVWELSSTAFHFARMLNYAALYSPPWVYDGISMQNPY